MVFKVSLEVERLFGSEGDIQLWYSTVSSTAVGGEDFVEVEQGTVSMSSEQTSASLYIQVYNDTLIYVQVSSKIQVYN